MAGNNTTQDVPAPSGEELAGLPPLERSALLVLHAWAPDPGAFGWHVNEPEALCETDLTLSQFRAALSRLARKGLVECAVWHPGQGNGAAREWLWFLTERGRDVACPPTGPAVAGHQ